MDIEIGEPVRFGDLDSDDNSVFLMQMPNGNWSICMKIGRMEVLILQRSPLSDSKDTKVQDKELVSLRHGNFGQFPRTVRPETLIIPIWFPTGMELDKLVNAKRSSS